MNKKITIIMSIIEIVLQSILFLTGMVVICYEPLGFAPGDYPRCMTVVAAVIFMWILRHIKISKRKFYICHAIPAAAAVIMGRSDSESFLTCILMLLLAAYSSYIMYRSERPDKERPSYFMLAVMLLAFVSGGTYNSGIVIYTSVASTAAFVVLSVLYENLFRMKLVFRENQNMSDFPAARLIKVNGFIMLFTLLVMLAAMFLFKKAGSGDFTFLSSLGIAVGRAVATFIIWLIEMLGKFQDKAPEGQPVPDNDTKDMLLEYMTSGSDGTIEKIINSVIAVAAIIILAAAFIAFVRAIGRFMRKEQAKREGNDIIEFVKDETKESTVKTDKAKTEQPVSSDNERFRKLYRGAVKKQMKKDKRKSLPVSMTPADITNSNITSKAPYSDEITAAYETARYSQESVTKEQIEQLRRISKKNI